MPRVREPQYERVIRCSGCSTTVHLSGNWSGATDTLTGRPVSETFRWHRRRERFLHQCRSCERARRGLHPRTPRTTTPRSTVPGTTIRALGRERKFGVELELTVPVGRDTIVNALIDAGISVRTTYGGSGWKVKGDSSIRADRSGHVGVEVVSPPLTGTEGEQQVRTVCRVLRELGGRVNRTCGTHVHHDVNDLTVEAIKRVARGWARSQPLIDGLVSPSRRGGNGYCRHLSSEDLARIDRCSTLEQIKRITYRGTYGDRYRSLNLQSYGKFGTVEVRQHQGTLNAAKIVAWIQLGRAIIDHAKINDEPLVTHSTLRDLWGALGSRMEETARTYLTGRAVEYGMVAV